MARFEAGKSGNPGGRPKGFGRLIRDKTKGGREIVDLALEIMRGEVTETRMSAKGEPVELGPSCRERLEAAKWLAERGWGRAPEMEPDEAGDKPAAHREMTADELEDVASGGEA